MASGPRDAIRRGLTPTYRYACPKMVEQERSSALCPREVSDPRAKSTSFAAEKIRRQKLAAVSLAVFVETNRFKPADPQHASSRSVRLDLSGARIAARLPIARAVKLRLN
jgi:hypothetical protein